MSVKSFAQNIRRSDCVGPTSSHIECPKLSHTETTVLQSNYPNYTCFSHKKSESARRFVEIDPDILDVFYEPLSTRSRRVCAFFFAGILRFLKAQIKTQNSQLSGETKKNKNKKSANWSKGAHRKRGQKFQDPSLKNRVDCRLLKMLLLNSV